jgi:hypothetical protein
MHTNFQGEDGPRGQECEYKGLSHAVTEKQKPETETKLEGKSVGAGDSKWQQTIEPTFS